MVRITQVRDLSYITHNMTYSVVHYIQYDILSRTLHIIRCTQSYTTYNTTYPVVHYT